VKNTKALLLGCLIGIVIAVAAYLLLIVPDQQRDVQIADQLHVQELTDEMRASRRLVYSPGYIAKIEAQEAERCGDDPGCYIDEQGKLHSGVQ
jgi:hypothetical protein